MTDNPLIDVSPKDESTENVSSIFSNLYKYSGRTFSASQRERRELFLKNQKEKRQEILDEKRNLLELFNNDRTEPMDVSETKIVRKVPFAYKLMQAEFFSEIPADLTENWLVKFCPEGVRYLVVANKANTTCYLRNGKECMKFKSNLPGGNKENLGRRFTVLDCIYSKTIKTFFVYDVLAWNSLSLLNSEAQFRFFWLKSKFEETPELLHSTRAPNYSFVVMDSLPADLPLIQNYMSNPYLIKQQSLAWDGLLFYHKDGHYVSGRSPLIGWLKSFMLNEKFNIDVHPIHLENKPENYQSLDQFLNEKPGKRRGRRIIQSVEMADLEEAERTMND